MKKFTLTLILIVLFTFIMMLFLSNSDNSYKVESSPERDFIISFDHSKVLKPSEFKIYGMPYDLAKERLHFGYFERIWYQKSFWKFPTVSECLSANARTQNGWDLTRVNWSKFNDVFDVKVCIFRIADALGDIESAEAWIKVVGFGAYVTNVYADGKPLIATWAVKQHKIKSPFNSFIFRYVLEPLAHAGVTIGFEYKQKRIQDISLNYSYE
jgi:hypothetical protein